ncbi:MAG: discoidin domain-containing protein [Eubacterium ventriosum]
MNGGSWKSVTANQTADWNDVREVSTVIELKRGENTIDITGASNIWYAGTGDYWQQINLDYFDISSPLAEGIHEAEEYHVSGNKSDDKQYKIKDDGGGIYSENKYATIWNTLTGEEHEYLGYNVYAQHAGKYKLAVKYGTKYDGDIFVKIGKGEWKQLSAPSTGEWNVVKTVEMDITLPKGENTIYIAGRQTTGNKYNEYINIDCFELTRQVDKSNIALDKPVRTSGNRSDDVNDKDNYKRYFPEEAVDGYDDSRWGGRANQNENWFEIDLEGIYEINQVMLKFERAYPKDFEIQVSRDRKSWTTTETVKGWTPSENADPNAKYQWNSNISYHGKARYIRINATSLKNKGWGLSIWEFVVKGDKLPADVKDVAVNKTATASSSNENEVAWAIDGKDDSRWGSISGDAQWYQINLGKEYALHSVDLKFERAYPEDFTIKTSKDGKSWETIKTVTGWKNPGSAGNLSSSARVGYSFKLDSEKMHLTFG